ncbi:MAG: hypothetical protein U9O89_06360 [Thermoproteota archaeon]|nr:hypothetical protein [Thermoproteota archaeon]
MGRRHSERTDVLGLVSFGFFLALIGVIFMITPNLWGEIRAFFRDFQLKEVRPDAHFPTPKSHHQVLYDAAFQFCLAFAISQILILIGRFILRESIDRKSGTFSGLFFWFGAAAALNLLSERSIGWFEFWGWIIILVGTVVVVRGTISLCTRALLKKR